MFVAPVLIPLDDNDGVPFSPTARDAFRDRLLAVQEGLNIRTNIRGVWVFEGRVYDEACEEYRSAPPSIRQIPPWLEVV